VDEIVGVMLENVGVSIVAVAVNVKGGGKIIGVAVYMEGVRDGNGVGGL
jgi:hypothetical protein